MPKKPTRKMPRPMPRKRMLQEVERLSKLEAETREPIDPRMKEDPTYKMSPKDPNYKVAPRRTKPKNQFRDNPEDRFGEYRVSEAKKGKMMKAKYGSAAKTLKKNKGTLKKATEKISEIGKIAGDILVPGLGMGRRIGREIKERNAREKKRKSKEGFEKFDREKRQRERQGDLYIESARKGGMMKDIMGDKKGRVIYKGKAKDYKMIIPIEPPSTPSEATSKMKKMKGGMVRVKTRLGRTKPTKIY
jgi:hypothetical protein